jgi:16S rRNA (adenine1518-N6/adenine1519-N6)-dimethyltransferase
MKLPLKRNIKNLLKKYQIWPSKRLGQNFLIDELAIKKVIRAADLKPGDVVLEIGPGLGVLTVEIAKKAKMVIAVEKDPKMCQILKDLLKCWNVKNVEIVNDDILFDTKYKIQNTKYKVAGNLPFYLTAPVIRKFLELIEVRPQSMVLVVQKEVGQRICAKPNKMSILAVSVQFYAKPEIISFISKKSFWPQPKVDSAIIKITPKKILLRLNLHIFFKIVKAGFSQPRKQLINNLSKSLKIDRQKVKNWLLKNNIQPSQRAETLTIKDWINLTKTFKPR